MGGLVKGSPLLQQKGGTVENVNETSNSHVKATWSQVRLRRGRGASSVSSKVSAGDQFFPLDVKDVHGVRRKERWGSHYYKVFVYAKDLQTISVGRQTHMDYRRQQWKLRCFSNQMNAFINCISLIPWQLHVCLKSQPLPQASTAHTNITNICLHNCIKAHICIIKDTHRWKSTNKSITKNHFFSKAFQTKFEVTNCPVSGGWRWFPLLPCAELSVNFWIFLTPSGDVVSFLLMF